MRIVSEQEIRSAIQEAEALTAAERAFHALGNHAVTVPPPVGLSIRERGELHVKAAHLHGSPYFVIKAATGFYDNPERGLPSGSGLVLVFDAQTGFPLALLQDNGYLTEIRTAAAAAFAARLLAHPHFETLGILGAGAQARYQLRAFSAAFRLKGIRVWARSFDRARELALEMSGELSCDVVPVDSVSAATAGADVVLTLTPSTTPLLQAAWLEPHATVIAVGADSPEKRELAADVLRRADKLVVDSLEQCARLGELHHGLAERVLDTGNVYAELGEIATRRKAGREADELIVCDLTGVGAQDAAIAELACRAVHVQTGHL